METEIERITRAYTYKIDEIKKILAVKKKIEEVTEQLPNLEASRDVAPKNIMQSIPKLLFPQTVSPSKTKKTLNRKKLKPGKQVDVKRERAEGPGSARYTLRNFLQKERSYLN